MSQLETRLIQLAAKRFGRDPSEFAAGDDFYEKLGIDSMIAMELLTEVEDAFGVEIPDFELRHVHSFASLAALIERRL